jgi:alkanesulfonate monooxygenase SsuD/methylene tetrahydromethanopterin reductase-like flavin-dependent oxidoreductase (luciferase family)
VQPSGGTAGNSGVSARGMEFSVYYWGNDDLPGPAKYELLLEGAKFADANGFCAVWTPERHFHAFGGPYPNPSVTGAAAAAVTKTIGVRAGSIVAPLHHPARIAEEWAVIDNLTNGRAGLAFASGWQPDDFRAAAREHAPRQPSGAVRRARPGAPVVARRGGGVSAQGRHPLRREDPAPPGVEGSRGLGDDRRQPRNLARCGQGRGERADPPSWPVDRRKLPTR